MKTALVLYPNQLFALEHLPQVDTVVLVEEPLFFGTDQEFPVRLHKQKLILHWASMRRYAEEVLWANKFDVEYIEMDVFMTPADLLHRLRKFDKILMFDPLNDVLVHRLLNARREQGADAALEFLPSPNFYLKDQEVRQYFGNKHRNLFADFYQWQRERFNILIDDNYKPEGGKWLLDAEKQQRPADVVPPSFQAFGSNKWVEEATDHVNKNFADNPGSTDFIWPTSHKEAEAWLEDFVDHRLDMFASGQGIIDAQAPWLYHSVLSSSLNIGLLMPEQVIMAALRRNQRNPVPLPSLEAFVRQILGWREYTRGAYVIRSDFMQKANYFRHKRKLTSAWFDGTTGIPPFDAMVQRLDQRAYAHHSERLLIAGNLMLMCEIDPREVHGWFNQLFIDAYDWSSVPSVYSISQYADGGSLGTVPPILASNHLLQISNYERGDWADVWDGLFWRFVEKHKDALGKNPAMRPTVQRLARLDHDRKRIIHYRAEDFLAKSTR